MNMVKAKAYKTSATKCAHLDEIDESIIANLRNLATLFHKKASEAMKDENCSPDEIYNLVSKSRSFISKASSYEREKLRAYNFKHDL